jgi:hypothetical protein
MITKQLPLNRIILIALGLLVFVLGVLIFIAPTAIYPDPSWGFQVLQKMQAGGAFNITTKPDPADLSKNYSEFLSWWSPGQYLVPYFFIVVLGVNIGQASAITTGLCSLLGIAGFYTFFKKAGFTKKLAAISVAVIVAQQAFITPYIFYNGGEVLLFGFAGWFLYGCINFDKPGWQLVLFLLFAGWLGFFCKSAFLWMYAAGCIYLWISLSQKTMALKNWIINGVWIAIPSILSLAAIYFFYLSKGANPTSASTSFFMSWKALLFPLASPILAGFSVDDMVNGLLFHNNATILSSTWSFVVLVISAAASLFFITRVIVCSPDKKYKLLLIVFYVLSVLFFGYSFLRGADISYEARHFRIIGLLITPGIVYLASKWKAHFKYTFVVASIFIAFLSFRYFAPSYHQNKTKNGRGTSGLAQLFLDQESLNKVMTIDKENTNAIFVFISPDLGLEIKHNRYVILDPIGSEIKIDYDSYVHYGHAGPMFIVLPSNYMGPKSNIVRKCFPGYKGFHMDWLSDKYVMYSAK